LEHWNNSHVKTRETCKCIKSGIKGKGEEVGNKERIGTTVS
jgi:hypothetical protein